MAVTESGGGHSAGGLVGSNGGLIQLSYSTGAVSSGGIRVSPWWLIVSYFISELGELCISPVGLSAVTKLAPLRIVGLMMGVWFLSNAFGNKLAGWAAGFFSSMPLNTLFGYVTVVLMVSAGVMLASGMAGSKNSTSRTRERSTTRTVHGRSAPGSNASTERTPTT